jgi:hypothetical protein
MKKKLRFAFDPEFLDQYKNFRGAQNKHFGV